MEFNADEGVISIHRESKVFRVELNFLLSRISYRDDWYPDVPDVASLLTFLS